jgi:hypothetical protein
VIIAHGGRPAGRDNQSAPFQAESRVRFAGISDSRSRSRGNAGITGANAETPETTSLRIAGSSAAVGASKKIVPISVFVIRKLSRLFVRRGFSPLFDVPVKIANPEEPLGMHVFTAMELQNEAAAIRWTVVSIPEEFPRMPEGATKGREAPAQQTVLFDKANAALDRIEISQDTVERLSELLTPASSPRSSPPNPAVWVWDSRSAGRSSMPTGVGCGPPRASRGVLFFSLRSPLTEPPSVIDVACGEGFRMPAL